MTLMISDTEIDPSTLRGAWDALREANPKLRIRDAAAQLGVGEAQLLATRVGEDAVRLDANWGDVLKALPGLGHVMALTRNEHAVHERKGCYGKVSVNGAMGLVLDEEIDLRVFLSAWRHGFAVREEIDGTVRRSLHFFDAGGTAVHKVYQQPDGDPLAFEAFVERFEAADQSRHVVTEPVSRAVDRPEEEIDFARLYESWRALRDTHDFHGMLADHGVSRRQALRRAAPDLARAVEPEALRAVLVEAAGAAVPIMVFVGSRGVIQIHTGTVERVVAAHGWVNVLDARFNLHVRASGIDSAFVVRKPTDDGTVTSLELLDAEGSVVALIFGRRKPGNPESDVWRELIGDIEAAHALDAVAGRR